jgi:iron complex transport system substrate-binding protein
VETYNENSKGDIMRIISICPSNTELLEYLGMTEHLVAVDNFSDWPLNVHHLQRVGPDLDINMELVEQLKPDIVLASLSVPGMEKNVVELQKRNIPHLVLNPNSLNEIANDLLTLGDVLNAKEKAQLVVQKFHHFIHEYKQLAAKVEHQARLYWEWWPKPVFTPGGENWLTEISLLAGGVNIFADQKAANVQTDWEEIKARNPEHICLAWVGVRTDKINPATVQKRDGWEEIEAIQKNRIYILEEALYCRPSPRLLLGLKKLAAILHPDIFPPYDGADPLLG